jgi:hypothetical protein
MAQQQIVVRRRHPAALRLRVLALGLLVILSVCPAFADDEPAFEEAAPAAPVEAATPEDAAGAPSSAQSNDSKDYPRCIVTKERWDTSSTRVEAIFRVDGQRMRGKFLSLPYMLIEYKLLQEDGHRVSIETVSVLDYPSFGSGSERMIPINDDWNNVAFLNTDTPLKGTKRPYFAAFSDIADLEAAKEALGGSEETYEDVLKKLLRALKDDDVKAAESLEDAMRREYKVQEWGAEE